MPPKKESAKDRKAREKAEKFAAQQLAERLDMEADEEKARQWQELVERMERTQLLLEFHEALVHPSNKLMISHTAYDELRAKMQKESSRSAERVLSMQVGQRQVERHSKQLQQELVHLRSEVRTLSAQVSGQVDAHRHKVHSSLQNFVDSLEASIVGQREDAVESGNLLNLTLEESRVAHVALAKKVDAKAQQVTALWQDNTSMHTRIPPRIRATLTRLDKDDLMLILDTLSFDDTVLKYLQYRYSPGPDDPFADTDDVAPITNPAAIPAPSPASPTEGQLRTSHEALAAATVGATRV